MKRLALVLCACSAASEQGPPVNASTCDMIADLFCNRVAECAANMSITSITLDTCMFEVSALSCSQAAIDESPVDDACVDSIVEYPCHEMIRSYGDDVWIAMPFACTVVFPPGLPIGGVP